MADADPLALVVRFGLYVVLGLGFGLPLFELYTRRDGDAAGLRATFAGTAAVGAVLSCLGLVVLAASMAGVAVTSVDAATLGAIVALPAIGTAWLIRMTALVLLAIAALTLRRRRPLAVVATATGGVALASLAWTGHGNMSEGVEAPLHLGADIVHLLTSGAWLGALVALALLVARPAHRAGPTHVADAHSALAGFATIGTVVVGLIVASGLVNAWMVIGVEHVAALATTPYGWLFIAKLALFSGMLALAAANRFRLTPALERAAGDPSRQLASLRTSLIVETLAAVAILALVAWLGLLAPPGSMG